MIDTVHIIIDSKDCPGGSLMVAALQELIGIGIYTPDEAARYARVSVRTMQRWIFGEGKGHSVIRAELAETGEKIITFLDFVQAMAVRSVRISDNKFPLQKIRRACDEAMDHYNLRYPLAARDHKISIFGPQDKPQLCEMVISIGQDERGKEKYMQLTGKNKGNLMITDIAEPFMQGLDFGGSKFAERYTAWKEHGRSIIMDPRNRLGEPYLPSSGYTALALWEAYQAEGGVAQVAKAYGVDREEVELACSYFDFLVGSDAA